MLTKTPVACKAEQQLFLEPLVAERLSSRKPFLNFQIAISLSMSVAENVEMRYSFFHLISVWLTKRSFTKMAEVLMEVS